MLSLHLLRLHVFSFTAPRRQNPDENATERETEGEIDGGMDGRSRASLLLLLLLLLLEAAVAFSSGRTRQRLQRAKGYRSEDALPNQGLLSL